MSYRVVTKDGKFSVQKKSIFGFWVLFEYGVNEGGGSYFILEDTVQAAKDKFFEVLEVSRINTSMGSQGGWTPVEKII